MNNRTLIAATLALTIATPAFALTGVGSGPSGDTTYTLEGAANGYSGWIEFDSPSGSLDLYAIPDIRFNLSAVPMGYSGLGSPTLVGFDISTPYGDFSSSNPDVALAPGSWITWNANGITAMNTVVDDFDPAAIELILRPGQEVELDVFPGVNVHGRMIGAEYGGVFSTPDGGTTWVFLAGTSAALAGVQIVVRRRAANA